MNSVTHRIIIRLFLATFASPAFLRAHCDTMDGPVVLAARAAMVKGDVTPVLMWVKADDEAAIRAAFAQTLVVRRQSKEAANLADRWFFETPVRVHRAGEGAPYTGLKSGSAKETGIEAADHALATGKVDAVMTAVIPPLQAALREKFERVAAHQAHASHSVAAGREYVAAYVEYVHFAEHLATLGVAKTTAVHAEHSH